MKTNKWLSTPALYPATLTYGCAIVVIVMVSAGWVRVLYGISALGFATVLIILMTMRHELNLVHGLVNHRSDEQLRRIDQLTAALVRANIVIPVDPAAPETTDAVREQL